MKAFFEKIDKRTILSVVVTILIIVMYKNVWPYLRENFEFIKAISDYRKLILATVFLGPMLIFERQSLKSLGFTIGEYKKTLIATVLTSVLTLVLVFVFAVAWKMLGQLYVENEYIYFIGNKIPFGRITYVTPFILFIPQIFSVALPEELIYRGYFQSRIGYTWGPVTGIVASSVVFTLIHFDRPLMLVHLAVLSPVLGYTYYKTKSIYPTVFAHAIGNTFSILIIKHVALM